MLGQAKEVEDTNIQITCEDDKELTDDPVMDEVALSNDSGKLNILMQRNNTIKQGIATATMKHELTPLRRYDYLDMGADMEIKVKNS